MSIHDKIKEAEKIALRGEKLNQNQIIELLEISPSSIEMQELGESARRISTIASQNKGKVWTAIGLDNHPCKMNCKFCAFGEKWQTSSDFNTWSEEEIMNSASKYIDDGATWVTLRTTEHFNINDLIDIGTKIKNKYKGSYKLVANTSEVNAQNSMRLKEAGYEVVYHAIRLREGIDTPFDIKERERTLTSINHSSLDLAFLVEPIGIEHSNSEIAELLLKSMTFNTQVSGAMARVPVPGTPLYDLGALPEMRLAQIIAVTRLCAGIDVPDICVHPPSKQALNWGANVVVVENGSIPRDCASSKNEWQGFDILTANNWFKECRYELK